MTKCLGFSKKLSIIHSKKFPCSVALPIENNLFDCAAPCKNFLISYKGNAIMKKRGEDKRDATSRWLKDRAFGGKLV